MDVNRCRERFTLQTERLYLCCRRRILVLYLLLVANKDSEKIRLKFAQKNVSVEGQTAPPDFFTMASIPVVLFLLGHQKFLFAAGEQAPDKPIVVSKFILNAKEIEFDGVAQKGHILNYAISEHVEVTVTVRVKFSCVRLMYFMLDLFLFFVVEMDSVMISSSGDTPLVCSRPCRIESYRPHQSTIFMRW